MEVLLQVQVFHQLVSYLNSDRCILFRYADMNIQYIQTGECSVFMCVTLDHTLSLVLHDPTVSCTKYHLQTYSHESYQSYQDCKGNTEEQETERGATVGLHLCAFRLNAFK